jgi:hypothetical protein
MTTSRLFSSLAISFTKIQLCVVRQFYFADISDLTKKVAKGGGGVKVFAILKKAYELKSCNKIGFQKV